MQETRGIKHTRAPVPGRDWQSKKPNYDRSTRQIATVVVTYTCQLKRIEYYFAAGTGVIFFNGPHFETVSEMIKNQITLSCVHAVGFTRYYWKRIVWSNSFICTDYVQRYTNTFSNYVFCRNYNKSKLSSKNYASFISDDHSVNIIFILY